MNIWLNSFAYFALIGAFGFGLGYNALYSHYAKQGLTKRYTAIAVVIGCAILILISGPFIGLYGMLYLFALFGAAGGPMTWGDMKRSQEAETKDLKEKIKQAKTRRGPREWPNHAKDARDDTAEELNTLERTLAKTQNETDPAQLKLAIAHTRIILQTSLRRLESVDAPTRPPQP